jgi:hypothetical protein
MHVAILNIIQLLHVLRAAAQRASFTQIHGFLHTVSSLVCLSFPPLGDEILARSKSHEYVEIFLF